MTFGTQLGQGLGFMSQFPTPASAGLGAAAAVIGTLSGPAEAKAIYPYAEHWRLFEPGAPLWGAPLIDRDFTGGNAPLRVRALASGVDPKDVARDWFRVQRGTWLLAPGISRVRLYSRTIELQQEEQALPQRAGQLRVSIINAVYAGFNERQRAMYESSNPSFHYIDLRTWAQAEQEYWQRSAPEVPLAQWRSLRPLLPNGHAQPGQPREGRNSVYERVLSYYADARAEHAAVLEQNQAWFEHEKAVWLDWKEDLARQAAIHVTGAALEQAIHDYVANAADPDAALQAVANGDVRFALGGQASDNAPSMFASGAPMVAGGTPGTPGEQPSSSMPVLAFVGLVGVLLLIGASE